MAVRGAPPSVFALRRVTASTERVKIPISVALSSTVERFVPSLSSHERCSSEPETRTPMPFSRMPAEFSARYPQATPLKYEVFSCFSPDASVHVEFDATENASFALPPVVKVNSGSAVRLPDIVVGVCDIFCVSILFVCPTRLTLALIGSTLQPMTENIFETRLSVVKHMSQMLLEMADIEWDDITKAEELTMLEDYEEVASHLLDSLTFTITSVDENGDITANLKPIDPEEYVKTFLAESEAE